MSSYFRHNAEQIIYIFAYLIVLRTNQGKRALLICKKTHRDTCITQINALFCRLGYPELHALNAQDWIEASEDVRKKATPVLHYGIIGVNDFADFDCAYCLMGYYLPTHVVSDYFQEFAPYISTHPPSLSHHQNTPYRVVEPVNPRDAIYTDYLSLGQQVLQQEELGAVMQTVGRVRPFTKPREIITFQCGLIPGVVYDQEFTSLEDVRRYFGIKTARTMADMDRYTQVQSLKAQGYTQRDISSVLNISRSTVQRE